VTVIQDIWSCLHVCMCPPFFSGDDCTIAWIDSDEQYFTFGISQIVLNVLLAVFVGYTAFTVERIQKRINQINIAVHSLMFLGCIVRVLMWVLHFSISKYYNSAIVFFIFFFDFFSTYPTVIAGFMLVVSLWKQALSPFRYGGQYFIPVAIALWILLSIISAAACVIGIKE